MAARPGLTLLGKAVIALFVLALAGGAGWMLLRGRGEEPPRADRPEPPGKAETLRITGYHGGEKSGFLANPEVVALFAERYRLSLLSTPAGSVEMVRSLPLDGKDCVWPSTRVASELYRLSHGAPLAEATVFRSPLVLYSWREVTEALERQGIAAPAGGHYQLALPKLVELVEAGRSWSELGLPQLYGRVKISSTDPTRSNSGNMFFALLATLMNGGEVPTEATLPALLPRLAAYHRRLGHMEHSSGDIFDSFLEQGLGSWPIIAGYENQLIEYSLANSELAGLIRERVRVLYPVPTVWSDHPLIAVTAQCQRLAEALADPDVQRLAWQRHGFRSGFLGVTNDPGVLDLAGVPASIDAVVPLPNAAVSERLVASLSEVEAPP